MPQAAIKMFFLNDSNWPQPAPSGYLGVTRAKAGVLFVIFAAVLLCM